MPRKRAQLSRLNKPVVRGSTDDAKAKSREAPPARADDDNIALIYAMWRVLSERRADILGNTHHGIRSDESSAGARNVLVALLELSLASVKFQCGDHGLASSRASKDVSEVWSHVSKMLLRLVSANALIDCGDFDLAEELLKRARSDISGNTPDLIELDAWPWPIKIHTLGRFDVLLHDKRPEFSRKVPRKVLSLLKAIIAFGGREVPEPRIIDALWPDLEGDAARHALTAMLHRLRIVLGDMKAIVQAGGGLSLDERLCWTDAHTFESLIERSNGDPKELEKSLVLYRGAFLPQEESCSWTAPMRERLRAKFIHAVGVCGAALETAHQLEEAIDLYSRGIEADNLVEPFYQGLMRCYEGLNRRAEAVSVYRRLRDTLSIILGISPSSATQRLYETLRLN